MITLLDYTGELKVILANLSNEAFTFSDGERIAQIVLHELKINDRIEWESVTEITRDSKRGSGGFGSTGKN